MIGRSRLLVLATLTFALGAATCQQKPKPSAHAPSGKDDAGATDASTSEQQGPTPLRVGLYTCSLQIDEGDEVLGQCNVSAAQKLSWVTTAMSLKADLGATGYGFAFKGTFTLNDNVTTLSSELFRQGGGRHALVAHLGDGRVMRFALLPAGATTAR